MFLVPGILCLMECLGAHRRKDLYGRTSFPLLLFHRKCSDMTQMPSDLHTQSDCAGDKSEKGTPEIRFIETLYVNLFCIG